MLQNYFREFKKVQVLKDKAELKTYHIVELVKDVKKGNRILV